MATKKDPEVKENVDRTNNQPICIDSRNNNDEAKPGSETVIKNANAAGTGVIGRNDEKQTDYTSNEALDTGNG